MTNSLHVFCMISVLTCCMITGCSHYRLLYLIAFAPARQTYRTEVLFTNKNGDFEAIPVTERSRAAPILIFEKKKKNGLNGCNASRLKCFLFEAHSLMVVIQSE